MRTVKRHSPDAEGADRAEALCAAGAWGRPSCHRREQGLMLVDCLVYIAIWMVVAGVGFSAFYRCFDGFRSLSRNADDVARVLRVGERWREDVRQATGPMAVENGDTAAEQALHIPQKRGEVIYLFGDGAVHRLAGTNGPWVKVLPSVKSSRMQKDQRRNIVSWRWETELQTKQKRVRLKPLFTFEAVAPMESPR